MKRFFIFLLFALAFLFTYVSLTPHNSALLMLSMFFGLLFFSFLIAFLSIPWHSGTSKERFKKGLKTGLLLSAGSYVGGYCFILLESIIR